MTDDFVTDVIAKKPKTKFTDLKHLFLWCRNLETEAVPPKMRKDLIALYDASKDAIDFINHKLKHDNCDAKASFYLEQSSGRLIVCASVDYEIDLGLCWTCYSCERTFTKEAPAWSSTVGIFPHEYYGYYCAECESYWYGRENYGKEKPDYLDPKKRKD